MSMVLCWAVMLTLFRSIAVSALCTLVAVIVLPTLRENRLVKRAWWLILLPLLMPPLVIGYAYSNVALSLVRQPVLNDLLYSLLLGMRFFPVTLLLLHMAPPPPLSASAMHTLKLGRLSRFKSYFTRGEGRVLVTAWALVFVLCFTEFEITSRMGCTHWTIWLFDVQVGGAPLSSTLSWLILPMSVSLLLLIVVFLAMPRRDERQHLSITPGKTHLSLRMFVLVLWWISSMIVCLIIPWLWVLKPAIGAMSTVIVQPQIWLEIGYSVLFAVLSTALIWLVMGLTHRLPGMLRWALCLPGLAGSLVVGLVMLSLFQTGFLNPLYDSPLPLVLALMVIALPAGLLLGPVLRQRGSSRHMAWLTRLSLDPVHQRLAKHLRWQQHIRGLLLLTAVLLYITYHDLPASALLSPPGMQPSVVRLYNLMHYGKYETLSAMVVLTYMLPPLVLAIMLTVTRGRKLPTHG